MSAFASHFSFEFRTGLRNRTSLLMNYLFPLGLYVLLGFLMAELNPDFVPTMIPAMIIVAILSGTVLGMPNPLVAAREAGIFRSYKINGVPASSILTIPALTTALHMVVVAVIITATASPLFDASLPTNWAAFILVFLLAAFASAGLGLLIGVISSSTQATVLWAQLVFLPSMLIGGLMLPSSLLPDAFGKVGLLLPSSHAMNAFKGWALGQTASFDPLWSVIILLAGGILSFGLAIYLFSWDSRNATRRGHPALALLALVPYVIAVAVLP